MNRLTIELPVEPPAYTCPCCPVCDSETDKLLREYGDCHTCVHDRPCSYDDIPCIACERSENWEWGMHNG